MINKNFLFKAPRAWDTILGTEENPYDATKSGPLCPQLGLDSKTIDHYVVRIIILIKACSLFSK